MNTLEICGERIVPNREIKQQFLANIYYELNKQHEKLGSDDIHKIVELIQEHKTIEKEIISMAIINFNSSENIKNVKKLLFEFKYSCTTYGANPIWTQSSWCTTPINNLESVNFNKDESELDQVIDSISENLEHYFDDYNYQSFIIQNKISHLFKTVV